MRRRMLFNKTDKVHNTTYLYYLGDECVDITGGWSAFAFETGYTYVAPEKRADNIYCLCPDGNYSSGWSPLNKIDLTGYNSYGTATRNIVHNGTGYNCATIFNNRTTSPNVDDSMFTSEGIGGIRIKLFISDYQQKYVGYFINSQRVGACSVEHICSYIAKQDNLQGLSAYGSDISTIISNASSLLQDHNAVVYMLNNCTGDFMWSALADSTFVSILRTSPYYSEIMADEDWNKALALLEV